MIATRLKLSTVDELRQALQAGKADGMMTIGPGKLNALREVLGLPQVVHLTAGAKIRALEEALHGALCMLDQVDKSELAGTTRWHEWTTFVRDHQDLWATYNRVALGKEVSK